ncbi:MAG: aminotransferase class V-fold PLP-dependent enzyme [Tannerellaceae bacterium]|jgi:O-acetylhomoserine (thiol)-lyase|nr:aminotransferase class V-fold PLP-dependent enzyme [Tannerellaceae bacterium]
MSTHNDLHFDTLRIHAGYSPREHNNSVQVPIYQTASFDAVSPERAERLGRYEETGFLYSRLSNPTVIALEARVAALDHAKAAVALASGMAAVSFAILNAAEGGRVIAAAQIYGGTFDAYKKLYPNLGVQVDVVQDINNLSEIKSLIRPDTRAVFLETVTNPLSVVANIEAIASLAHQNGLPLIVDNTLATPYLLNPIKYGADVVVYSATKALSGHGSAIGGIILESGAFNWLGGRHPHFEKEVFTFAGRNVVETFPDFPFTARVRTHYLALLGASLSPFDAFLILQGIETLSERVKKQSESAVTIARYLAAHPQVKWVSHPATGKADNKARAEKYLPLGSGGVFSFGYAGGKDEIYRFIKALNLFSYHPNIGDARSLIINAPCVTHHELTPEESERAGIYPETIRLSIGLEHVDDLLNDLRQAFENSL